MKVICRKNTAKDFDLKEVTTVFSNEHEYPLEIGREHRVMGMAVYKDTNCIYYLIDINSRPFWFPYLLFSILDNSLPNNWFIKVYDRKDNGDILYVCAFDELCNDDNFHDLLMDQDEAAMRTYFRHKIEYEKAEEDSI